MPSENPKPFRRPFLILFVLVSAIGVAVGEIVGEALLNGRNPATLTSKEREQILAYSKLVAGTVSGVAGGDVNAAANAAQVAVENNSLNLVQENLLSGDYTQCIVAGGSDSFCGNYINIGIPHFIAVDVAMPQGIFIGKSTRIVINTRNGDLLMSVAGGINDSRGSGKFSLSTSVGWVANLSPLEQRRLGESITATLEGVSVGGKACFYGGCFGISATVNNSSPKKFTYEFGPGIGYSVGGEVMGKIGKIK